MAIRAYVAELDILTTDDENEKEEELLSKPMKFQFWKDNLALVHKLLAVPQIKYKLKPIRGKERKYKAEFTVKNRFWYTKVPITLPEINEPPVTANNRVFKLN